jgi:hypothetical protein
LFHKGLDPFFIIGAQRSGTTLLRLIINSHSQVAIPEEGTFLMPLLRELRGSYHESIGKKQLKNYIKYIQNNHQFMAWKFDGFETFSDLLKKEVSLKNLIESLYIDYAASHGKVQWGDKTPSFFRKVVELSEMFPNAKFINVVRDGRDVYLSMRRREWGRKNASVAALEWAYKVRTVERSFKQLPFERFHVLRFEDLIRDPEGRVKEVCQFLGINFEVRMLEFWKTSDRFIGRHHSALIFKPISDISAEKWRKSMTLREKLAFELIAKDCLRSYGYALIFKGWINPLRKVRVYLSLVFGLPLRALQVIGVATILKVCARCGVGTGVAGGSRYLKNGRKRYDGGH